MTRFKIIFIFLVLSMLGCVKEQKVDDLIKTSTFLLEFETISFSAKKSNISSDFSNQYYISSDTVFIYNPFRQSIEYLDFSTLEIKNRFSLKAGHNEIIQPSAFVVINNEAILINSFKIQKFRNSTFLKEYNLMKGHYFDHIFEDNKFINFLNIVEDKFGINDGFFDNENQILYMVVQNGFDFKEYVIITFDLNYETVNKLITIDLDSLNKDHKMQFNINGNIISNVIKSNLLFNETSLVLSLPHNFNFMLIELENLKLFEYEFDNLNFKSEKDQYKNKTISDIKSADEAITQWSNDIDFGPIKKLNDKYFIRIVKDDARNSKGSGDRYFLVFDQNFTLIDQINLSTKFKNLSLEYFTFKNQVFIKQDVETENIFDFTVLKLIEN